MQYVSSRGSKDGKGTAADAVRSGIAPDGGLFVPTRLPLITTSELREIQSSSYSKRAHWLLSKLFPDYSPAELDSCVTSAYNPQTFSHPKVAPVVAVGDRSVMELWHGPTSAFKDLALQIMPRLLSQALVKTAEPDDMLILVATSGDTGKAALEGFKDVPRTKILVFYPEDGVSEVQKLQMITQEGTNVGVVAVQGNFDDAQTGVKHIFSDVHMKEYVQNRGLKLSSANSINWGRLAPQVVYYFSAYADMVAADRIAEGEPVNFIVPTGNFGNILAGYYAREMGLPIHRLICASNDNNVLTDFLQTGRYDRNRPFHQTSSPSMDILISSNLERLLYHVTEGGTEQVSQWMNELNAKGFYEVPSTVLAKMQDIFWADWCSQAEAGVTIRQVWESHNYLLDPHTAVAWKVCDNYVRQTGDTVPNIVLSTASPFKFAENVLEALDEKMPQEIKPLDVLALLSKKTGWVMPDNLARLRGKAIRHVSVCGKQEMVEAVKNFM